MNNFFKNFKPYKYNLANEALFRFISNSNINLNLKNALDIGFSNISNLLELKKRGLKNLFGIDIRSNAVKYAKKFLKNKKNFFLCDLNKDFPKLNKKMDIVLAKDLIYYLHDLSINNLFYNVHKILKKNKFFIFSYITSNYIIKNDTSFHYKNFIKLNNYFQKNNPIRILNSKFILKLIKKNKFKIINSAYDMTFYAKKKKFLL